MRFRDHDKIDTSRPQRQHPAIALAHPALDPIASHGVADLLAHGDTKAGAAFGSRTRRKHGIENIRSAGNPTPALLYRQKARPLSKSLAAAKPLVQASVGHRNLFLGNADRELLAPFAATAVDYFAPRGGAHALPETVRAFPAPSVRLIRPLHWILRSFPGVGREN